ncbi:T9SS type A sorting domain-containing protein [Dyadobacter jiangsuensis]|uniref:Putative secreted protein (Por secretion system target) n=1 Tax=Dyadobacter jiangsuensis TaxID=1591085 RepID=A0A2P8FTU1_9BACT|nr:T9SS type A sorting domain-containing protein [Dyadobacter jiangsuensis]PSL25143.1 putative secreted protein (Por secretion system target) [Dyadobacter jiangsuensis]
MKTILLSCIAVLFSTQIFAQSLESDRLALVAIYTATSTGYDDVYDVPNFNDITGWNVPGSPGDSPCGWTGVTCEGGRVTRLDLSMFQVHGPIAPEIGNLSALTYLNLQGSGEESYPLVGELPTALGNLTNLEYLNIGGNALGWTNVSVIGSLIKLKELRMDTSGDYPAEFANLVNLETCVIGQYGPWSGLNIKFPDVIYQWTKIKHLYMAGLVYTTSITGQIGNLSNLETLELGSLIGSNIPTEIGSLTKLTRLVIAGNRSIDRNIDAIPSEIGNLVNLRYLQLIGNNISGSIPASFTNLTELRELYLDQNKLSGGIPSFLGNLVNLQKLGLGQNQFSGIVPVELTTIPDLVELNLFDNQLSGPLPDLSALPASFRVSLIWNKFTFAGLEQSVTKLNGYSWQAAVPMVVNGTPTAATMGYPATLSVNVGGTPANNTYRWYKNNALQVTKVGDPTFSAADEATYHVVVTNSLLPLLTLQSVNYKVVRLPVTLVKFDARRMSNGNELTWKTTSETNNKGFEIERSADARTFEKIGFVDGSGDSKENQFYHFTDLNPLTIGYYRLKQLDYDGKFEYSKVIAVKAAKGVIKMYPNPAQTELTVEGAAENELVSVFTSTGAPVMKGAKLSGGKLDVKNLKEGIYTIKIGDVAKKLLIKR